MKKIPPWDCLGQTRTARLLTLPACVDAARLRRAGAAKHRSIAAAGLAGMLAAGHKGRAFIGGCLTQACNADARTGCKIGPSKRNMPPPGPNGFGVTSRQPLVRTRYPSGNHYLVNEFSESNSAKLFPPTRAMNTAMRNRDVPE